MAYQSVWITILSGQMPFERHRRRAAARRSAVAAASGRRRSQEPCGGFESLLAWRATRTVRAPSSGDAKHRATRAWSSGSPCCVAVGAGGFTRGRRAGAGCRRRAPADRRPRRAARPTSDDSSSARHQLLGGQALAVDVDQAADPGLALAEEEVGDDRADHRQPGRDLEAGDHRGQRRRQLQLAQPLPARLAPCSENRSWWPASTDLQPEQRVGDDREQRDQHADDHPALEVEPEPEAEQRHDGEDRDRLQHDGVRVDRVLDPARLAHQRSRAPRRSRSTSARPTSATLVVDHSAVEQLGAVGAVEHARAHARRRAAASRKRWSGRATARLASVQSDQARRRAPANGATIRLTDRDLGACAAPPRSPAAAGASRPRRRVERRHARSPPRSAARTPRYLASDCANSAL